MLKTLSLRLAIASVLASAVPMQAAYAQAKPAAAGELEEVIVTAQKRSQSINDVGLTIQAADAEALVDRGIDGPSDLGKLVAGFTYTESIYSTPVYTLRGIGLYDATFGAPPAVSVYSDQVPRNFPVMSSALDLDLERIEVLKGPQGTLFGQSSTGGAVNYITAKPTDELVSGVDVGFAKFGRFEASGYVSGPVSDTVRARLAVKAVNGGEWQRSISRPSDENGASRRVSGRLTVDWKPSDALAVEASVTVGTDHSDVQAPQYVGTVFNVYSAASLAAANSNPATANPFGIVNEALYAGLTTAGSPNFDATFLGRQATLVSRLNGSDPVHAAGALAILGTPTAPDDARAAEWTQGFLGKSDNQYQQGTVRIDYEFSDGLSLTSLTAFAKQELEYNQDLDGTTAIAVDVPLNGEVKTFNQEFRLSGTSERINWIVGLTYDNLKSRQQNDFRLNEYSANEPIPGIPIRLTRNDFDGELKTTAGFGNIEFQVNDSFSLSAGYRYTENKQKASYCYNDPAIDTAQTTAQVFSIFQNLFTGTTQPPILAGECFPLGDGLGGTTFGLPTRTPLNRDLDESNSSYRLGATWKSEGGTLLYATLSQGFKTGIFSAIGASSTSQYAPAVQEKVVAYELGVKAPLFDRALNVNAAVFFYDYKDKQVRGRVSDAIYGLLEKMVNVPKSEISGFEVELVARPMDGLTLSASATYLDAKVTGAFSQTADGSAVYNAAGYTGDFKDSPLPFTPEFSANVDAQYEWGVGGNLTAFVGATLLHQGSQNTTFYNDVLRAEDFDIDSYTTLDVRAGIGSADGRWKATVYGRNVTDEVYTTSITTYLDTLFRFTGRPATYGISLSYRFE
jgi:iron complex outermembrane recepter protein